MAKKVDTGLREPTSQADQREAKLEKDRIGVFEAITSLKKPMPRIVGIGDHANRSPRRWISA